MNLFFRELKAYRYTTLIWILSLCAMVTMFLMMFPAFTKDVDVSRSIIESLPAAVRSALDISLQNFFTIYGFLAYLFTFATLAGAIQAMNYGAGIISKETSGKTADFLLTKPISRTKVFWSKVLAVFSLILVTNICFSVVAYSIARTISNVDLDNSILALILLSFLLVQLFFLALGILLSVLIDKIKSTISVSLPMVFSFFIIGTLGSIIGTDNVRYICPFKFYDLNYAINHSSYELKYLYIELVLVVLMVLVSYFVFIRKDVRVAA